MSPGRPAVFSWILLACSPVEAPRAPAPRVAAHGAGSEHPPPPREADELSPERVRFDLGPEGFQSCFQASATGEAKAGARDEDGKREGWARLKWQVDAEGHVASVEVEQSAFQNDAIDGCLAQGLKARNFGRPGRPQIGRWTFVRGVPTTPANRHQGVLVEDPADWDERGSVPTTRQIEELVLARFSLLGHCFREAVLREPGVSGVVRLRFTIDRDGSVREVANAGSTFRDRRVVPCMAEGFYALRFPPPSEPLRVFYPIEFEGA